MLPKAHQPARHPQQPAEDQEAILDHSNSKLDNKPSVCLWIIYDDTPSRRCDFLDLIFQMEVYFAEKSVRSMGVVWGRTAPAHRMCVTVPPSLPAEHPPSSAQMPLDLTLLAKPTGPARLSQL